MKEENKEEAAPESGGAEDCGVRGLCKLAFVWESENTVLESALCPSSSWLRYSNHRYQMRQQIGPQIKEIYHHSHMFTVALALVSSTLLI